MTASAAAKRVKEVRNLTGLTQLELVDLLQSQGWDVTQPSISKLERGIQTPTFEVLLALKEVLDINVNYFFDLDATPYLPKPDPEPIELDDHALAVLSLRKDLDSLQKKMDLIYRRLAAS